MIRYISLRLLFALPALWLIVTMVFLLAHIVPGDPVAQMLGEGARADDLQQLRHALGLDLPIPMQYGRYLKGVLHGNLGESFRFQQPVTKVIFEHYPATLELAAVALVVCMLIGIPAGVLAAHKRGENDGPRRRRAHAVRPLASQFRARPGADAGIFGDSGWLPVTGRGGISHLVLPAFTLGAALAAILTRMVRTSVIEELSGDYVRTARAKGVSESAVLFRHAFRNALIPILTILGAAIRHAARGHDRHRDDFFLAGDRAPDRAGDRRARLSAAAGLHSADRGFLRNRQFAHGPGVRGGGSAGAVRMKILVQELRAKYRNFCAAAAGPLGICLTLLLLIVALAAPWLAPYDPMAQNLPARLIGAERRALDGHRRAGPRHSFAHDLRHARFDAGERERGVRRGNHRPGDRRGGRLFRRMVRPP